MYYSPVRHSIPKYCVRLACIRHAASVHPEPGSNSPLFSISSSSLTLFIYLLIYLFIDVFCSVFNVHLLSSLGLPVYISTYSFSLQAFFYFFYYFLSLFLFSKDFCLISPYFKILISNVFLMIYLILQKKTFTNLIDLKSLNHHLIYIIHN